MSNNVQSLIAMQREVAEMEAQLKASYKTRDALTEKFTQGFKPEDLIGKDFIEIMSTSQGYHIISEKLKEDILSSMTANDNSLKKFLCKYQGFELFNAQELLDNLSWDGKVEELKNFLGESVDNLFSSDAVYLYFYEFESDEIDSRPEHNIVSDFLIKLT